MNDTPPDLTVVKREGELLDLDAYRQKRIASGTWPVDLDNEMKFWREIQRNKKK